MRIGIAHTPMETRRDVIMDTALLAEDLGFEVFSLAEGWAYDAPTMLAAIAARTRRIRLLPGVLSVWSRTPATLAMGAVTLNELSGGRAILGLGASTQALTEGLHDVEFARPARQLREVTDEVRSLLTGGRTTTGRTGARALKLGVAPAPDLPIWLAASGPRATKVVAECADGWYPLFLTAERFRTLGAEIRAASVRPMTIVSGAFVVAGDTSRQIAASCLAWYICAMGDGYAKLIADQGFAGAVKEIQAANPRPTPTNSVVPDSATEALGEFTVYGSPEEVRRKFQSWLPLGDLSVAVLPAGMPWPVIETTMRAVAPQV